MNQGECEGRRERLGSMENKMENKFLRQWQRRQTSRQADSDTLHLLTLAWLMYLCVSACVCVCVYANVSCEKILCGLRAHAVWEHCTAFTATDPWGQRQIDRQMERQLIISILVQRFSKPARSQRATYQSLFPSFSTTDSDPETPTWEDLLSKLATIGNSL